MNSSVNSVVHLVLGAAGGIGSAASRRLAATGFVLADPRDGLSADWFLNLGEYSTEITHAAELVPVMYDKGFECAQILVTHEGCSAAFGRTDAYLEPPCIRRATTGRLRSDGDMFGGLRRDGW